MNIINFLQDGWKELLGNKKDFEKEEMMDRIADQEQRWGERHGARQDEFGEWIV